MTWSWIKSWKYNRRSKNYTKVTVAKNHLLSKGKSVKSKVCSISSYLSVHNDSQIKRGLRLFRTKINSNWINSHKQVPINPSRSTFHFRLCHKLKMEWIANLKRRIMWMIWWEIQIISRNQDIICYSKTLSLWTLWFSKSTLSKSSSNSKSSSSSSRINCLTYRRISRSSQRKGSSTIGHKDKSMAETRFQINNRVISKP